MNEMNNQIPNTQPENQNVNNQIPQPEVPPVQPISNVQSNINNQIPNTQPENQNVNNQIPQPELPPVQPNINNQIPNEPNNKKPNSLVKLLKILIVFVILVGIVIGIGFVTYQLKNNKPKDNNSNNQNNNSNQTIDDNTNKETTFEKIDETKGFYYVQEGKSYTLYGKDSESEENVTISFSYPVINSKDESVTKINAEIKKIYEDSEKNLLTSNPDDGYSCVKINSNEKCFRTIISNSFDIIENESLINVLVNSDSTNYHGSSSRELIKSYFISKTTGNVLNNEEVVKNFGYDVSNFVTAYNSYLNELKNKYGDWFAEYNNIVSVDELVLAVSEEKKLTIYGPAYGNGKAFYLNFDGTKVTSPNE